MVPTRTSATRRVVDRRHTISGTARFVGPYAISPARRTARILLAPEEIQAMLRRIERSAAQSGIVLEFSHDTRGLREWQWYAHVCITPQQLTCSFDRPTHDRTSRIGSYVAASGLRVFLAERGISPPVCLHGRNEFMTREECETVLVCESVRGQKHYKFVCAQHLENDDCYYEVSLDVSPAVALHRRVLNPAFTFDAPPEYLYNYAAYFDDEEERAREGFTPPGLASFAQEVPHMPPQALGAVGLVETRALVALNSADGLNISHLSALHRLIQHCRYCDVVALPAAMRDHIQSGKCRRAIFDADDDNEPVASGSGSSRT